MTQQAPRSPTKSIGLAGDGDDTDLILAVEASFGVKFGDDETTTWTTVDDIYKALLERVPHAPQGGKCSTSMAFYRLRVALARITGVERVLTPKTKLRDLTSLSPKWLFKRIEEELGVKSPPITLSWWGVAGLIAILLGVIGSFVSLAFREAWPSIILLPLGVVITVTDSGSFYSTTLGDLSRAIAMGNFSYFAQKGADHRPQAVWRALCAVIGDVGGVEPSSIAPGTRLLA